MKALKINLVLIIFSFCFLINSSIAQWSLQTSGTLNNLYSVHFVSNNLGYTVGDSGIVLKTTNGGNNWSINFIDSKLRLNGVRFKNSYTGWAVGDNGLIMRTNNGGRVWIQQESGTNQILRSVFFINSRTGWVVGDSVILKTTNRGVNWFNQAADTMKIFYSVYFINSNTGWITGYSTLKTTNGGTDWVVKVHKTNRRSVYFADVNTGWVVGGVYTLNKSTDGGETWGAGLFIDDGDSPPATFTCVNFINVNTGWYTVSHSFGGRIIMTTNSGLSWSDDYPTTRNRRLYGVFARSTNYAWAVGQNGTILKRTVITGNSNNGSEIPLSYSLLQNYPNPFNPSTKIKFDIPKSDFVSLKIFDALGREVAALVNEQLKPGTYEAEFNGANFSSGVYFYKLTAGDYVETKKMVLVK